MTDEERKARDRERARVYRRLNPDKVRASKKACYTKHATAYRAAAQSEYATPQYRARKKAWRMANPGKSAAYTKKWADANKVEYNAKRNAKRLANVEAVRAQEKASRQVHRDRMCAAKRKYRTAHPGVERASMRAWQIANRPVVNAHAGKRRAMRRQATPAWASQDAITAIYEEAARLTLATGIPHEVDHIYPLISSVVCGLHVEANLQILTKTENRRKHNRLMPTASDWAAVA